MGTRIGFVGLGTMGRPMAMNLLNAGFHLRVFNRTASKMEHLVAAGAEAASSYADAASGCDVLITMLSDSDDVRDVVLGSDGLLSSAARGSTIIDMSTISPSAAIEIADACQVRGVHFLDAPVTGGESGAIAGTLSIMVGGSEDALNSVRTVLEAMGSKITYMGSSGSGQAAKACNQVICGLNILAVSEGLALAESAGLDTRLLVDAISGGAAGSWMLSNLAPKMIAGDWAPGFRIALQRKDLRLALELADKYRIDLLGTARAKESFDEAGEDGYDDEGTQALIKAVRQP